MKKIDTLKEKLLHPRKQTIDFLLNFSQSIEVLKTKSKNYVVVKN